MSDKATRMLSQHLSQQQRVTEGESKTQEGTQGYLRRSGPRLLLYLARGCDTYEVRLCPGYLGKDLYDIM